MGTAWPQKYHSSRGHARSSTLVHRSRTATTAAAAPSTEAVQSWTAGPEENSTSGEKGTVVASRRRCRRSRTGRTPASCQGHGTGAASESTCAVPPALAHSCGTAGKRFRFRWPVEQGYFAAATATAAAATVTGCLPSSPVYRNRLLHVTSFVLALAYRLVLLLGHSPLAFQHKLRDRSRGLPFREQARFDGPATGLPVTASRWPTLGRELIRMGGSSFSVPARTYHPARRWSGAAVLVEATGPYVRPLSGKHRSPTNANAARPTKQRSKRPWPPNPLAAARMNSLTMNASNQRTLKTYVRLIRVIILITNSIMLSIANPVSDPVASTSKPVATPNCPCLYEFCWPAFCPCHRHRHRRHRPHQRQRSQPVFRPRAVVRTPRPPPPASRPFLSNRRPTANPPGHTSPTIFSFPPFGDARGESWYGEGAKIEGRGAVQRWPCRARSRMTVATEPCPVGRWGAIASMIARALATQRHVIDITRMIGIPSAARRHVAAAREVVVQTASVVVTVVVAATAMVAAAVAAVAATPIMSLGRCNITTNNDGQQCPGSCYPSNSDTKVESPAALLTSGRWAASAGAVTAAYRRRCEWFYQLCSLLTCSRFFMEYSDEQPEKVNDLG
uniref:Uncharacterized protein n=1 Tax=Anopheles albimanus TaxID=7167 RepID=A0A8W7K945_ANOAL